MSAAAKGPKTPKKSRFSFLSFNKKPSLDRSPSESNHETSKSESKLGDAKEPPKQDILKKLGLDKKADRSAIAEKFKAIAEEYKEAKVNPSNAKKPEKNKTQLSFLEFLQVAEYLYVDNDDDHPIAVARKICDSKSHGDHEKRTKKTLIAQLEELSQTSSVPEDEELQAVFQVIATAETIFPNGSFTSLLPGKEKRIRQIPGFFDAIVKRPKAAAAEKEKKENSLSSSQHGRGDEQKESEEGEKIEQKDEEGPPLPPDDGDKNEEEHHEEDGPPPQPELKEQKYAIKKEKPPLTEEEKKTLEPLQKKADIYKALRNALDKRLSDYEGIVFDEQSTADHYAPLLVPIGKAELQASLRDVLIKRLGGEADIDGALATFNTELGAYPADAKEAQGQQGAILIEQAQQLRRNVVALKQEVHQHQQAQESKAGTLPYREALVELSRDVGALKPYSIKVLESDHKPADKDVEWDILYVYPTTKGWECAIKCPPETKSRLRTGWKVFRGTKLQFQFKRLAIPFAPAPTSKTLNAEQIKTLLEIVDAHSEQPNPQCTAIINMVREVQTVTQSGQPAQAVSPLVLKSHPNHPRAAESKRITTKLALQDRKDQPTATLEQTQLADFVSARKLQRDALWQQQIGGAALEDRKEAKVPARARLSLDAITLSLSKKAGEITQAILAKWPDEAKTAKARMETRIAKLRDLLHPLTTDSIDAFFELKDRYFTDMIGEFKPRFAVDIEMDKTAGEFYDFFVMACELCKGHVKASGRTLGWTLDSASLLITEGMQKAILESFVEHNATLLEHLKKLKDLKAKIKPGAALSPEDQRELEYADFIMGAYIERLASYLALYEETFGIKNETYRKILGVFEQAVINTAGLYIEYDKLRRIHTPASAPVAPAPDFKWVPTETHLTQLGQYQKFYQAALKPHHKAGAETPAQHFLARAMVDLRGERTKLKLVASSGLPASSSSSSSSSPPLEEEKAMEDLGSESGDDQDWQLALKLATEEKNETPGGPDEEEPLALELQQKPRLFWGEWKWWQVATLLALWVVVSGVAVALIATVAPHLLYLPLVATVLVYGTLGTVGGIAIGILEAAVVLFLLSLAVWGLVSWIRAYQEASKHVGYKALDIELAEGAQQPLPQPSPVTSPRVRQTSSKAKEDVQPELEKTASRGWC